jgi:hypothetical protein
VYASLEFVTLDVVPLESLASDELAKLFSGLEKFSVYAGRRVSGKPDLLQPVDLPTQKF